MIVVSLSNSDKLAKAVARELGCKYSKVVVDNFPDGELHLQYKADVSKEVVVIVESMQPNPTKSFLNCIFASRTAKDLGAKKVIFVPTYLAYMRQDKRFNAGEAINAQIMAKLVNENFDKILTVDPHLHRILKMKDIFTIPAKNLTSNSVIADFIKSRFKNVAVVGPDWESYQWADAISKMVGCEDTVFEKDRHSYRNVDVSVKKHIDMKGKNVVIVDDIISTGNTMIKAAAKAKSLGAKKIYAIGVHGLFVENCLEKMEKVFDGIFTCDTISHSTNKISVSKIIADELK